jgi:hypothetical protein
MDLTTLARVKEYLGYTNSNQDSLISALITRASGQIAKYCSRRFDRQSHTNAKFDGNGNTRLFLPNTPIASVSAVSIFGVAVPVSADGVASGYQYDDKMIYTFGSYLFNRGFRNVGVSYVSAFTSSETGVISEDTTPTLMPSTAGDSDGSGIAYSDLGVVFTATGIALTKVATAPATGQYAFSGGTYTFNATDVGLSVTMSYDYIPGAVEQACIEMCGLKIKQRDNIGISSRTLANESISYTDRDMTRSVIGMLGPYNRRIPV